MVFTQVTVKTMRLRGRKVKSPATLSAKGNGLMAMRVMKCRARGVNAVADQSVRRGRWKANVGPAAGAAGDLIAPPQTASGAEGDP